MTTLWFDIRVMVMYDIILMVDSSPFFSSNWSALLLNWCPYCRLKYVTESGTMLSIHFHCCKFKNMTVSWLIHFGSHSDTSHCPSLKKKWLVIYLEDGIMHNGDPFTTTASCGGLTWSGCGFYYNFADSTRFVQVVSPWNLVKLSVSGFS